MVFDFSKVKAVFSGEKKGRALIIAAGIAAIVLLFVSTLDFGGGAQEPSPDFADTAQTERELERRLVSLLSQIDGVGKVSVMVTLESTSEYVYAQDTKAHFDGDSAQRETEVVFAGSAKQPIEIGVIMPKVRGAAVVCSGASDPVVKARVAEAVCSALNIGMSRVSVVY